MTAYTATYSPDDNKLRLYAGGRLDAETYAKVKAAGFKWAPKQDLFVAPMWTPEREDLLIELCGEIGDEDTSLTERAEERAERFEEYSDKRMSDAENARQAVARIADNIPFGQPILVGHHSEKHARKDAEKIENGMRRAVKMWETSKYWEERAQGAIRHAKYKERPDVRQRRIKGLETDRRKCERNIKTATDAIALWETLHTRTIRNKTTGEPLTFLEAAIFVAGHTNTTSYSAYSDLQTGKTTPEQVQESTLRSMRRCNAINQRWIDHIDNRLAYERAMLADAGGTVTDKTGPEKGGACRCWASHRGGWSWIVKVNKVSVTIFDNWGNGGQNFTRTIPFDKLAAVMSAAQVAEAREAGRLIETPDKTGFFLVDTPAPEPTTDKPTTATDSEFEAAKNALRNGSAVQVVAAPQLFPTPAEIARQLVKLADIQEDHRVLEPSAGTGAILAAIPVADVVCVEINPKLAEELRRVVVDVRCADFLSCNGDLGTFDRIVMNPPFENGSDIKHIEHARHMLKPGGRLVAICANGPRQRERLQPIAAEWIDLPAGSFKQAGTNVNTAIVVIEAE